MDNSLSQPLISTHPLGISLKDLKQLFSISNLKDKASYNEVRRHGGTEGIMRLLQTSLEVGIDPNTVADRIKA